MPSRSKKLARPRAAPPRSPFFTEEGAQARGWLRWAADALIIVEAVRRGMIRLTPRRPNCEEKKSMIYSGAIFIFTTAKSKSESGMMRWTDYQRWSASRMQGPFLCYRQVPPPEKDKPKYDPPKTTTLTGLRADIWCCFSRDEFFVAGAVMKRTITVHADDYDYHIINYYDPVEAEAGLLPTISDLQTPYLRPLVHQLGLGVLQASPSFRNPPILSVDNQGRYKYAGEWKASTEEREAIIAERAELKHFTVVVPQSHSGITLDVVREPVAIRGLSRTRRTRAGAEPRSTRLRGHHPSPPSPLSDPPSTPASGSTRSTFSDYSASPSDAGTDYSSSTSVHSWYDQHDQEEKQMNAEEPVVFFDFANTLAFDDAFGASLSPTTTHYLRHAHSSQMFGFSHDSSLPPASSYHSFSNTSTPLSARNPANEPSNIPPRWELNAPIYNHASASAIAPRHDTSYNVPFSDLFCPAGAMDPSGKPNSGLGAWPSPQSANYFNYPQSCTTNFNQYLAYPDAQESSPLMGYGSPMQAAEIQPRRNDIMSHEDFLDFHYRDAHSEHLAAAAFSGFEGAHNRQPVFAPEGRGWPGALRGFQSFETSL